MGNKQLHSKILFTDKAMFSGDGLTNTWNSNIWSPSNPDNSMETHFQSHFFS